LPLQGARAAIQFCGDLLLAGGTAREHLYQLRAHLVGDLAGIGRREVAIAYPAAGVDEFGYRAGERGVEL
jgi:hypothetical protein